MASTTIDRLIINSAYEEPQRHWRYDWATRTFELVDGRRPAGYVVATPGSRSFDDPGIIVEIPLANAIRPRVKAWHAAGYPHVTINRRDLIAVPVPVANLLWRDLHVREGSRAEGKIRTRNVRIEITVEGVDQAKAWTCGLEFDHANEESFYCRPIRDPDGRRLEVPSHLAELRLAYLPPVSGLSPREDRLELGSINVRLGEGRTAEALRNPCWQVYESENGKEKWQRIVELIEKLFGARLHQPPYIKERGGILMDYRTRDGITLDLSASGRGQQQTLLLFAHMAVNPGAVLLLDEPDAHLEILRQRQIYQVLADPAAETGSQIIAASHSEVILNEAASRDPAIAFVGSPHRINDRGGQVLKALREMGFEHYYLAEETSRVVYVEGSTDLAMLRAHAIALNHPANEQVERPFVHDVANHPNKAREHFHALREAKPDLLGIAIYDRLEANLPDDPVLVHRMWERRDLENCLCQRETLLCFAEDQGRKQQGDIFAGAWREKMKEAIQDIEKALRTLGKDPWGGEIKASDGFFSRYSENSTLRSASRTGWIKAITIGWQSLWRRKPLTRRFCRSLTTSLRLPKGQNHEGEVVGKTLRKHLDVKIVDDRGIESLKVIQVQ